MVLGKDGGAIVMCPDFGRYYIAARLYSNRK